MQLGRFQLRVQGPVLARIVRGGLDVVLLGKAGIFCTKTASTCASNPTTQTNTLTHLADTEKYVKSLIGYWHSWARTLPRSGWFP